MDSVDAEPTPNTLAGQPGQLDYSPLTTKLGFKRALELTLGDKLSIGLLMLLIFLFVLLFAGVSVAIGQVLGVIIVQLTGLLFASALVIGVLMYRATVEYKMQSFAESNNMVYAVNTPFDGRPGLMFEQANGGGKFADIMTANSQNFSEVGNFMYTTGSGKNRRVVYVGFIRVPLPRRLPHMLLDAKQNNYFGTLSNLSFGVESASKISLEGEFDKHFTLYAPLGYEQDAFYVFTPDVMQALVDDAAGYDCEIIDDNLYIFTETSLPLDKPAVWQRLLGIIEKLAPELQGQTDFYADERTGNRALNIVAAPGARLKSNYGALKIISIILVAALMIMQFWQLVVAFLSGSQ